MTAPAPAPDPLDPHVGHDGWREVDPTQRTPQLETYLARTQTAFDFVALATIWLSIMPFTGATEDHRATWLAGRTLLSLVFLLDLVKRSRLAAHPGRYWRGHPLLVLEVLFPPVRVFFSVRLLRTVFRRGSLRRFMVVAGVLAANIATIVWGFEQGAPGGSIDTIWEAFWWAVVTLTTTGYGDYVPVTVGGRLFAVGLMALGVTTLAVVTAQIASSFRDQAARSAPGRPDSGAASDAEVVARLDRVESMLVRLADATPSGSGRTTGAARPADEPPSPGGATSS
jgi:voltage-gated potassium channel